MKKRYVKVDTNGLVVPPQERSCIGDECQYGTRCFIDRQHLYFTEAKFSTTALLRRFRENPFNSVWMSRCRHEELHEEYDEARIPPKRVMEAFLDEAEFLQRVGVTAIRLADIELQLHSTKEKDVRRLAVCDDINRFFDARDEFYAEVVALNGLRRTETFLYVDPDAVENPIPFMAQQHAQADRYMLAQVALLEVA